MWVPHDVRDLVVDFVRRWMEKTQFGVGRFIHWLGVRASKFYDWRARYGRVNEHNGWIPRDFWLEPWEKEAIVDFHRKNPLEGYRRLTFMMQMWWRSAPPAFGGYCKERACWHGGKVSRRAKGLGSSSLRSLISIGISMFPTST